MTDTWLAAQRAPAESETLSQQPQQRRGLVMDPNTGAYRPAGVASTPVRVNQPVTLLHSSPPLPAA